LHSDSAFQDWWKQHMAVAGLHVDYPPSRSREPRIQNPAEPSRRVNAPSHQPRLDPSSVGKNSERRWMRRCTTHGWSIASCSRSRHVVGSTIQPSTTPLTAVLAVGLEHEFGLVRLGVADECLPRPST